jgi:hypothetical protein
VDFTFPEMAETRMSMGPAKQRAKVNLQLIEKPTINPATNCEINCITMGILLPSPVFILSKSLLTKSPNYIRDELAIRNSKYIHKTWRILMYN